MSTPKTPFERLVDDLRAESQRRVVFVKALSETERNLERAESRGRIDDHIQAVAMQGSIRRLLDADHARRLRPGDIKRATAAIESGKSIPLDIVERIEGREPAGRAS